MPRRPPGKTGKPNVDELLARPGRPSKGKKDSKTHRSDLKYKEIRRLLARKEREKREQAEVLIEEL